MQGLRIFKGADFSEPKTLNTKDGQTEVFGQKGEKCLWAGIIDDKVLIFAYFRKFGFKFEFLRYSAKTFYFVQNSGFCQKLLRLLCGFQNYICCAKLLRPIYVLQNSATYLKF